MTYPNERLVLLPGIDDHSPLGRYKYHRTGYIFGQYCAARALEYLGCDLLLIDVDITGHLNTLAWDQVLRARDPGTFSSNVRARAPSNPPGHAHYQAVDRSDRSSEAPAADISTGNHGVSVYHKLASDMEHGESSQPAPADTKSVGDVPGPSSPYHFSYTAAASAPDHDTLEAAVRAALTTPVIDAMTDPQAFLGADGVSKYQSRRPDRRAPRAT